MSFSHNDNFQRGWVLEGAQGTAAAGQAVAGRLYGGPVLYRHTPTCIKFQKSFNIYLCKVPPKDVPNDKFLMQQWDKCRPWPGVLIAAPRASSQQGLTRLPNGATLDIIVGDDVGGEVGRRRIEVSSGTPVFLEVGKYDSFRASVPDALFANNSAPVRITWTDLATTAAFHAGLQSPPLVSAAPIAETPIPEGAYEVLSTAATIITQTDYAVGGGASVAFAQLVAAGQIIRTVGSTIATSGATTLKFFLRPL